MRKGPSVIWDWERISRRFRRRRKLFGWSIDEVSERTGVSRDTVMRVEKGRSCSTRSLHALRSAYALFSAQLTHHEEESPAYSACHKDQIQWMAATHRDHRGRPVKDIDYSFVNDAEERHRRATLGHQRFFSGFIRSELEDGVMTAGMMEIYQESWEDQHYGEELIFCVSGVAAITVEGDVCTLHPGDTMVFDALRKHRYAPAPGYEAPAIIMFVVATRPDEAERIATHLPHRPSWGV
jgi:transcriptional regulator with XRE-family HTH domain